MINTLSIVFIMHQWECILKLIQYQIPCMKQVAWTFSLTNQLEMVMFLLLSCDVLGSELLWNCIIKHHKYNYHKVAPFLLIHNVLFVRICMIMMKFANCVIRRDIWSIMRDHTITLYQRPCFVVLDPIYQEWVKFNLGLKSKGWCIQASKLLQHPRNPSFINPEWQP